MDVPRQLQLALKVKTVTFKQVATDLLEAFDSRKFRLLFVGPTARLTIDDDVATIIAKKWGITRKELVDHTKALMAIIHYLLTERIEKYIKIVQKKSPKDIKAFKDKIRLASRMLEKYPYIKNDYFVYSSSKTNFFAELEWEAGLKAAHSPDAIPDGSMPSTLPFARVIFKRYAEVKGLDNPESFEFEITERDLAYMVDSLKDLKNAMEELKTKKFA